MSGPKPDALPLGDTPICLGAFYKSLCLRGNYYSKGRCGFVNIFLKNLPRASQEQKGGALRRPSVLIV